MLSHIACQSCIVMPFCRIRRRRTFTPETIFAKQQIHQQHAILHGVTAGLASATNRPRLQAIGSQRIGSMRGRGWKGRMAHRSRQGAGDAGHAAVTPIRTHSASSPPVSAHTKVEQDKAGLQLITRSNFSCSGTLGKGHGSNGDNLSGMKGY